MILRPEDKAQCLTFWFSQGPFTFYLFTLHMHFAIFLVICQSSQKINNLFFHVAFFQSQTLRQRISYFRKILLEWILTICIWYSLPIRKVIAMQLQSFGPCPEGENGCVIFLFLYLVYIQIHFVFVFYSDALLMASSLHS